MEQKDFLELAMAGNNIDLSGLAGTGKTYVLKEFIKKQNELGKNIIVVAPTGIAAINVEGATIHSTFKIFGNDYSRTNKQKVNWRGVDCIIFDEKSMIGPDMFDHCSDVVCKYRKDKDKPFGGIQIILCGDMAQLPPIFQTSTKEQIENVQILKKLYGKLIYSSARAYKDGSFIEIFLTKIFRQSDNRLIEVLNRIRDGDVLAMNDLQRGGYTEEQEKESVHIMPYNNMVDEYNKKQFDLISEEEKHYEGEVHGKFNIDNVLTPVDLYLKKTCRVMLTRNIFEEGLYNGDIGTVEKMRDGCVIVNFDRVGKKSIPYMTWENIEYNGDEKEVIGSFTQIPLRLSYAITTHKSQGLSLKKVIIHYIPSMSKENLYVAVSRAEDYENLFLSK